MTELQIELNAIRISSSWGICHIQDSVALFGKETEHYAAYYQNAIDNDTQNIPVTKLIVAIIANPTIRKIEPKQKSVIVQNGSNKFSLSKEGPELLFLFPGAMFNSLVIVFRI